MRTPFLAPWGVGRSTNLVDSQLINLMPEIVETKNGKEVGGFYMTPGLTLEATAGNGPVRGFGVLDETLYCVSGAKIYSVNTNWDVAQVGSLSTTGNTPVSMIANGTQLAIFDGVTGTLVKENQPSVSTISLPFSGPLIGTYQDTFGLVNQVGTNQWWQSNSSDLSKWDALNFSSADSQPTDIVSMLEIRREQWLFKSNGTEIWINAGLPGFAFQRIEGVYLEEGISAPYSAVNLGVGPAWLSSSDRGQGVVLLARGYEPVRISTHALEHRMAGYPTISDAIAYGYQQEGHVFYVITFPSGNETWAYDLTESQLAGQPMWHQRAFFSNGKFSRHPGNASVFFNGKNLVGDWRNGNIYALDMDAQTDNGSPRKWLRTWRALQKPVMEPTAFAELEIDMQVGIGVPSGTAPQCMLRWSDDGGHKWSNERLAQVGPTGATNQRVRFNRLGSTKRNVGLDRIFELSSTDPFSVTLMGAELK